VPSQWFELFGDALIKRKRVHMRYQARSRQAMTERDVAPQRLFHYRSTWYLDARCHTRERLLRFALDAIEQSNLTEIRAKDVAMRQMEAEMDAGYGIYAGRAGQWATLRVSPQAAQWVSREEWHPDQKGRWLDDGAYELKVPFSDETELVMDVLRQGAQVEVLSPPSLRKMVGDRLQEALATYRQ